MARKKSRWVVKAGSQMVCEGGPLLIRSWMHQVAALKRRGVEIVWVTSGAIAGAVERTGFRSPNRSIAEKQALSAIGQPLIMDLYNLALQSVGCLGAQALLTYDDFKNSTRKKNLENTLVQLMKWNAIPILNENDVISTEEIHLATMILIRESGPPPESRPPCRAHGRGGLVRQRPQEAQRRPHHPPSRIGERPAAATGGAKGGSVRGTGGMYSKLRRHGALEGASNLAREGRPPASALENPQGEPWALDRRVSVVTKAQIEKSLAAARDARHVCGQRPPG